MSFVFSTCPVHECECTVFKYIFSYLRTVNVINCTQVYIRIHFQNLLQTSIISSCLFTSSHLLTTLLSKYQYVVLTVEVYSMICICSMRFVPLHYVYIHYSNTKYLVCRRQRNRYRAPLRLVELNEL